MEDVKALQKTVTDENPTRESVDKEFSQMKTSVLTSDLLATRLMEPRYALETIRMEVASLKEQVSSAEMEKPDFNKVLAEVLKESEKFLVHLNVVHVSRNGAEKLARSLVTELVNDAKAVVQQLGYDAVNRLRQGLKRAYSAVLVLCLAALTRLLGVAVTRLPWKGEESGDKTRSGTGRESSCRDRTRFCKGDTTSSVWQKTQCSSLVSFSFD